MTTVSVLILLPRSLCENVRENCVPRMKLYGYPWPDLLNCDKFPEDNDMCIMPVHDIKREYLLVNTYTPNQTHVIKTWQ